MIKARPKPTGGRVPLDTHRNGGQRQRSKLGHRGGVTQTEGLGSDRLQKGGGSASEKRG